MKEIQNKIFFLYSYRDGFIIFIYTIVIYTFVQRVMIDISFDICICLTSRSDRSIILVNITFYTCLQTPFLTAIFCEIFYRFGYIQKEITSNLLEYVTLIIKYIIILEKNQTTTKRFSVFNAS